MGGEGHMFAMIRRNKENLALKKSRREKFKANQELYTTGVDDVLEFKEVSKEELAKIRQKNLAKIKQQELNRFLKFIGFAILIGLVSYLLFGLY